MRILLFLSIFSLNLIFASECSNSIKWSLHWKFKLKKHKLNAYNNEEIKSQVKAVILDGLNKLNSELNCSLNDYIEPYYSKNLLIRIINLSKKKHDGLNYNKILSRKNFIDIDIYTGPNNHLYNSNNKKNAIIHEFLHFLEIGNLNLTRHNKLNTSDSQLVREYSIKNNLPHYEDYLRIESNEVDSVYACSYYLYPFMPFLNFSSFQDEIQGAYRRACDFCLKHLSKDSYNKSICESTSFKVSDDTYQFFF